MLETAACPLSVGEIQMSLVRDRVIYCQLKMRGEGERRMR